jgi:hypothetical protein
MSVTERFLLISPCQPDSNKLVAPTHTPPRMRRPTSRDQDHYSGREKIPTKLSNQTYLSLDALNINNGHTVEHLDCEDAVPQGCCSKILKHRQLNYHLE